MAQKRKTDQSKLIAEAALDLANAGGWDALSLKDVARRAKLPPGDVEGRFPDIFKLLEHILTTLDADSRAAVAEYLGDSWRDNLMELLMARFDIAQRHRAAYSALGKFLAKHPRHARRFIRGGYKSLGGMLEDAGLDRGKCQPIAVAALGVLSLSLVDTWLKDETADMAKTMAAIDKRLDLFDQALGFLSRKNSKAAA